MHAADERQIISGSETSSIEPAWEHVLSSTDLIERSRDAKIVGALVNQGSDRICASLVTLYTIQVAT
jgi:hypothetical protein